MATGALLVAVTVLLVAPIQVGGADCGTLFTSSDQWVSPSPGGPESDGVQLICHGGHTRRLVWIVALALPALALPCLLSAVRYLRAPRSTH
ncbi:MAG: hypothetical protein ABW137_04060 [Mycobacterium sp.]